jgi:hypothetical protein
MGPPKAPRNAGKVPTSKSDQTIPFGDEAEPVQVHDYPTVLVAGTDDGLDGPLVNLLQRNGFHVLEAHDWATVLHFVSGHSRPIHLLLADVSMDARMPILKMHRSELQVLFVEKPVNADDVLAKVRQLLGSLPPSSSSIR